MKLTREEVLALQANTETNYLVANTLFGWDWLYYHRWPGEWVRFLAFPGWGNYHDYDKWDPQDPSEEVRKAKIIEGVGPKLPAYFGSLDALYPVIKQYRINIITEDDKFTAAITHDNVNSDYLEDKTLPMAIIKCALMRVFHPKTV